jgi:hypothetical protein
LNTISAFTVRVKKEQTVHMNTLDLMQECSEAIETCHMEVLVVSWMHIKEVKWDKSNCTLSSLYTVSNQKYQFFISIYSQVRFT